MLDIKQKSKCALLDDPSTQKDGMSKGSGFKRMWIHIAVKLLVGYGTHALGASASSSVKYKWQYSLPFGESVQVQQDNACAGQSLAWQV